MAIPIQAKGHEPMGEDDQGQDTELRQEIAILRDDRRRRATSGAAPEQGNLF